MTATMAAVAALARRGRRRRPVRGLPALPVPRRAAKNQVRWQFGVLGRPGAAARALGEEPDLDASACSARRPAAAVDTCTCASCRCSARRVACRRYDGFAGGRAAGRRRPPGSPGTRRSSASWSSAPFAAPGAGHGRRGARWPGRRRRRIRGGARRAAGPPALAGARPASSVAGRADGAVPRLRSGVRQRRWPRPSDPRRGRSGGRWSARTCSWRPDGAIRLGDRPAPEAPRRRPPAAASTAAGRCWPARGPTATSCVVLVADHPVRPPRGRRRRARCDCSTRPRSTRSSPCGC